MLWDTTLEGSIRGFWLGFRAQCAERGLLRIATSDSRPAVRVFKGSDDDVVSVRTRRGYLSVR